MLCRTGSRHFFHRLLPPLNAVFLVQHAVVSPTLYHNQIWVRWMVRVVWLCTAYYNIRKCGIKSFVYVYYIDGSNLFLIVTAFVTPYYCVECANLVCRERIHIYCGLLYSLIVAQSWQVLAARLCYGWPWFFKCSCYIIKINICDGSWWHLRLGCYSTVIELWCKIDWCDSITSIALRRGHCPLLPKGLTTMA